MFALLVTSMKHPVRQLQQEQGHEGCNTMTTVNLNFACNGRGVHQILTAKLGVLSLPVQKRYVITGLQ
jgi:hypothetical protein